MRDIVRINGTSSYNYNGTTMPIETTSLTQPVYQYDKAAADSDVTGGLLMIGRQRREGVLRAVGNGVITTLQPSANVTANTFNLHGTDFFVAVDGDIVDVTAASGSGTISLLLSAPPGAGTRFDLVWLEVWYEEIAPAVDGAGTSATIYKYGNTQNPTTLTNALINPAVGVESMRAIQRRYRLRSTVSATLTAYGDGFSEIAIAAQAGAASDTAQTYSATASSGLPLYVAGDGTASAASVLKTVDGYSYAIPLYKVRRNTTTVVAIDDIWRVLNAATAPRPPQRTAGLATSAQWTRIATTGTALSVSGSCLLKLQWFDNGAAPDRGSALIAIGVDKPLAGTIAGAINILQSTTSQGTISQVRLVAPSIGTSAAPAAIEFFGNSSTCFVVATITESEEWATQAFATGSIPGGSFATTASLTQFTAPVISTSGVLASGVATGTPPVAVVSTTACTSLNADMVDGFHASSTPAANKLVPVDGTSRLPTAIMPLGMIPITNVQGNSPTDFSQSGTNNYAVASGLHAQMGSVQISIPVGQVSTQTTITFPTAFTSPPMTFQTCGDLVVPGVSNYGSTCSGVLVGGFATTQMYLMVFRPSNQATTSSWSVWVDWLAIGY